MPNRQSEPAKPGESQPGCDRAPNTAERIPRCQCEDQRHQDVQHRSEASVAVAVAGRKRYQVAPPIVMRIAPIMAGRADRDAIMSRSRASRIVSEA